MPNGIERNYHCHTYRCQHAFGEDEEFAKAAFEQGFKALGFSDHVMLPGFDQKWMRGSYSEVPGYLESIASLKKQYEGRMDVFAAFECEWLGKRYEPYYRELLSKGKVDYLILGQHGSMDEEGHFNWYGSFPTREEGLRRYGENIVAGIRSGLFSYVCHPDVYVAYFKNWDAQCEEVAHAICRAAKEMGIPLEVNLGASRREPKNEMDGSQKTLTYPYPDFWKIAKEEGCSCIIGVDAHSPNDFRVSDYEWALRFAKGTGCPIVTELPFRGKKGK